MSDDRSNKRLKEGPEASGADARDARIHALERENGHLRQQLARSDAENARLRQQLQGLQGNHEALAVSTFAVVDLSRIDFGLLAQIASFVGTSRDLFDLALTCKSFGWQQPTAEHDLSVAEEVARQILCSGRNIVGARVTLSPYVRGTTTWLSILRESEHPLKFDTLLGLGIEHTNERRTSVHARGALDTAVASNYVMVSGIHYAEFHIDAGSPCIGIVRPMPCLDPERYANGYFNFFKRLFFDDFMAARTDEWGSGNVHTCRLDLPGGRMSWTNWASEEQLGAVWEGMEGCKAGGTVGMLLNLNEGTLAVYENNRRLGVMKDGLTGSYCWCTSLGQGDAVTIRNGEAPSA